MCICKERPNLFGRQRSCFSADLNYMLKFLPILNNTAYSSKASGNELTLDNTGVTPFSRGAFSSETLLPILAFSICGIFFLLTRDHTPLILPKNSQTHFANLYVEHRNMSMQFSGNY